MAAFDYSRSGEHVSYYVLVWNSEKRCVEQRLVSGMVSGTRGSTVLVARVVAGRIITDPVPITEIREA